MTIQRYFYVSYYSELYKYICVAHRLKAFWLDTYVVWLVSNAQGKITLGQKIFKNPVI